MAAIQVTISSLRASIHINTHTPVEQPSGAIWSSVSCWLESYWNLAESRVLLAHGTDWLLLPPLSTWSDLFWPLLILFQMGSRHDLSRTINYHAYFICTKFLWGIPEREGLSMSSQLTLLCHFLMWLSPDLWKKGGKYALMTHTCWFTYSLRLFCWNEGGSKTWLQEGEQDIKRRNAKERSVRENSTRCWG